VPHPKIPNNDPCLMNEVVDEKLIFNQINRLTI